MTIVVLKVLIKLWILDGKFYLDFKKKKKKKIKDKRAINRCNNGGLKLQIKVKG